MQKKTEMKIMTTLILGAIMATLIHHRRSERVSSPDIGKAEFSSLSPELVARGPSHVASDKSSLPNYTHSVQSGQAVSKATGVVPGASLAEKAILEKLHDFSKSSFSGLADLISAATFFRNEVLGSNITAQRSNEIANQIESLRAEKAKAFSKQEIIDYQVELVNKNDQASGLSVTPLVRNNQ